MASCLSIIKPRASGVFFTSGLFAAFITISVIAASFSAVASINRSAPIEQYADFDKWNLRGQFLEFSKLDLEKLNYNIEKNRWSMPIFASQNGFLENIYRTPLQLATLNQSENLQLPLFKVNYGEFFVNSDGKKNKNKSDSNNANLPLRAPLKDTGRLEFPFPGYAPIAINNLSMSGRWQTLMSENADKYFSATCNWDPRICRSSLFARLKKIRSKLHGQSGKQLFEAANRMINEAIPYMTDYARRGVVDYWDDFADVMRIGSGDCEDIALVKFWILASLGVPKENMGLMLVHVKHRRADHAVLVIRTLSGVYYLDNLNAHLLTQENMHKYAPIAALSYNKNWIYGRKMARQSQQE